MPTLAAPLDFAKLEGRNVRIHQLSTAPGAPVEGQEYYNTVDHTFYVYNGTSWIAAQAPPPATISSLGTIQLAGDLAGTATLPQIAAGAVMLADCNSSLIDQAAATASLRTLGLTGNKAMPGITTLNAIPTPTADVAMGGFKITGLATPVSGTDAVNLSYVNAVTAALTIKSPCRMASNSNTTISAPGANTDGIVNVVGDRILLKNQTLGQENGIYIFQGAAVPMTRATDYDTSGEVAAGNFFFITEGVNNQDSGWVMTTDNPITLGTTPLVFQQFSGAGQINAGAGMTKTGNTLDIVGTATRITVNADNIDIAAGYAGQNTIGIVGTLSQGIWNATPIDIAYGGTGQITAKLARETGLNAAGWTSSAVHGAGTTIQYTQAQHGLRASQALIVQCQIAATGVVVLPDITVDSAGLVTVTFSASQSANTIRTTIIG
jgi:hypothetical protein